MALGAAVVFGMAVNTIFATIYIPNWYEVMEHIQEKFPHFPALWLECRQDSLAQRIDEFVQILRIININIDAMILLTDVFLLKTIINQSRLT